MKEKKIEKCIGKKRWNDPDVEINDEMIKDIAKLKKTYIGDEINEVHAVLGKGNVIYRRRSLRTIFCIHLLKLKELGLIRNDLSGHFKVRFATWGDNATILKRHTFKALAWILEDQKIFCAKKIDEWEKISEPLLFLYGM